MTLAACETARHVPDPALAAACTNTKVAGTRHPAASPSFYAASLVYLLAPLNSNTHLCAPLEQLPRKGHHAQHHVCTGIVHKQDCLAVGVLLEAGEDGVKVVQHLQGTSSSSSGTRKQDRRVTRGWRNISWTKKHSGRESLYTSGILWFVPPCRCLQHAGQEPGQAVQVFVCGAPARQPLHSSNTMQHGSAWLAALLGL